MCRPGLPLLAPAPTSLRGGSEPARHPTQLLLISTVPNKLWQSCPCRCLQHRAVSRATPKPLPLPQRNGYPYVLWTRDIPPTTAMVNSYGAWPFVMVLESGACRAESCVSLWGVAARSTGNVARRPSRGFSSMQCCLAMLSMSVPSSSLVPIPLACCRRHGLGRGAAEQQWPGAGGAQQPADVPDDWRRHRPGEG